MHETHCIYCGSKMEWGADFLHEEIFPSDNENIGKLTVTEMICMKCGAAALFVESK